MSSLSSQLKGIIYLLQFKLSFFSVRENLVNHSTLYQTLVLRDKLRDLAIPVPIKLQQKVVRNLTFAIYHILGTNDRKEQLLRKKEPSCNFE